MEKGKKTMECTGFNNFTRENYVLYFYAEFSIREERFDYVDKLSMDSQDNYFKNEARIQLFSWKQIAQDRFLGQGPCLFLWGEDTHILCLMYLEVSWGDYLERGLGFPQFKDHYDGSFFPVFGEILQSNTVIYNTTNRENGHFSIVFESEIWEVVWTWSTFGPMFVDGVNGFFGREENGFLMKIIIVVFEEIVINKVIERIAVNNWLPFSKRKFLFSIEIVV